MTLALLAFGYLLTVALDVWTTVRSMRKGLLELNPLINKCVARFGLAKGVAIGLCGPASLLFALGLYLGPLAMSWLFGLRFGLFVLQVVRKDAFSV